MLWGSTSTNIPSRFLNEIPSELVRDVVVERGWGSRLGSGTARLRRPRPSDDGRTDRPGRHAGTVRLRRGVSPGDGAFDADGRRRRAPASTGAELLGLEVGDRGRPRPVGRGRVVATGGEGDDAEAEVTSPRWAGRSSSCGWPRQAGLAGPVAGREFAADPPRNRHESVRIAPYGVGVPNPACPSDSPLLRRIGPPPPSGGMAPAPTTMFAPTRVGPPDPGKSWETGAARTRTSPGGRDAAPQTNPRRRGTRSQERRAPRHLPG